MDLTNVVSQGLDIVQSEIDRKAQEERRKTTIKYIIYGGATLALFAIVVFSLKKLKK